MNSLRKADLEQFTGTENWYRHGLVREVTYTDGVRFLAVQAGAYWLIDKIATVGTMEPKVKAEEFQVWTLAVEIEKGWLVCTDGNENEVWREEITWTDFPLDGAKLFFTNNTILLPSEY